MIASVTTNSASVQPAIAQPGSTAAASATGSTAAMNEPTYGTKRSSAPSVPHRIGLGTPISSSPSPMMTPNEALMHSWVRK